MITAAAIYIRLSLEDGDLSGDKPESESITNQRKMLTDYIRATPDLCGAEIIEFCDDGYSGKNFDRPGVKRLMEAARSGAIQCIVVKDISRFGRDYIVVGNYISRVFPFLNVRFIAVNDHFDSSRRGDIDSLDTSFRTLIYDMYSRDLSNKVRNAKKHLAERGVYINPVAPFGYRKDPNDRHKLIPDPATADVVRRIFSLVAEGVSTEAVARMLNAEQVLTPSQTKVGTTSEHANWSNNYWRPQTVSWIVRDRQYIGSTVFGKRVRNQIGVRRQVKAWKENWIVVDDRHEPLVSKELFQRAQKALGGEFRQTSGYVAHDNPLRKKVYCGVCGYAIVRRGTKNRYYCCKTPRTVPGMECCQEKVYEEEICDVVTGAIRAQAHYAVDIERIMEKRKKQQADSLRTAQKELQSLRAAQEQLSDQGQRLYEDFVEGTISRATYNKQKAALAERQEEINRTEDTVRQRIGNLTANSDILVEKYRNLTELDNLTAEIATDLLNRVTIWPDGRMEVELNYLDEIALAFERENSFPLVQKDLGALPLTSKKSF